MKKIGLKALLLGLVVASTTAFITYKKPNQPFIPVAAEDIKVPAGFKTEIIASNLGATRHLTISKNGDIYAKLSKLKDGKGIYLLRDTNKDGQIDETTLFGDYPGTGILINGGYRIKAYIATN
jgi:hypothetical protein